MQFLKIWGGDGMVWILVSVRDSGWLLFPASLYHGDMLRFSEEHSVMSLMLEYRMSGNALSKVGFWSSAGLLKWGSGEPLAAVSPRGQATTLSGIQQHRIQIFAE